MEICSQTKKEKVTENVTMWVNNKMTILFLKSNKIIDSHSKNDSNAF